MLGGRLHVRLQEERRDAEPARVRQQMSDVDEPGAIVVPGRDVFTHEVFVGKLPVLHQHRDGGGHRGFGVGGHAEHGTRLHGDAARLVPPTQRLVQHDLAVLRHEQHRAHEVAPLDGLLVERHAPGEHARGHADIRRRRTRDDGSLGVKRSCGEQGGQEQQHRAETGREATRLRGVGRGDASVGGTGCPAECVGGSAARIHAG